MRRSTTPAEGGAPLMPDDFDAQVTGIAALGEPLRRALYRYVVAQGAPVSRDQAAEATGIARHAAKFHLDKLAEEGLLAVEYRRPPGRRGPGAGRPAKLYRRSDRELRVSLPERRYELVGRMLAEAIVEAERRGVPVREALREAARRAGRSLGSGGELDGLDGFGKLGESGAAAAGTGTCDTCGAAASIAAVRAALAAHGYEPRRDADGLTLANCPFKALAQDYTELVCGMNLELVGGLLAGLGVTDLEARLDPAPGRCCVTVRGAAAPARKES
jgi:predicted ArsR family transcriptional regulator